MQKNQQKTSLNHLSI